MQYITRKGSFDSGHRVMNERMKCFNLHGHTYLYELTFSFEHMKEIGYAIDFKEIKRIGCQWIDDYLDHGMILNPQDRDLIEMCRFNDWKVWQMSLEKNNDYCNPTVENIAQEILLAQGILFSKFDGLNAHKIVLHETPNCSTECFYKEIPTPVVNNFATHRARELIMYADKMGIVEYDDRRWDPYK